MRRLSLILLPLLLLACGSSPPAPASPVPTIAAPSIPAPLLAPTATALPVPDGMCEMNTECFWQAYQQCATSQRLAVLLAGPTLVHGDTVTRWRNILLRRIGGSCAIQVADQTSIVQSNGNVGGAPGDSYLCMDMERDPSGALHITVCTLGSMPFSDIDVPPHE